MVVIAVWSGLALAIDRRAMSLPGRPEHLVGAGRRPTGRFRYKCDASHLWRSRLFVQFFCHLEMVFQSRPRAGSPCL